MTDDNQPHPATAFDCLIVGGGPAGLSAALQLKEWGREVIVVDCKTLRAPVRTELISSDDRHVLRRLGILPIIEAQNPVQSRVVRDCRNGGEEETLWDERNSPCCVDHLRFVQDLKTFVRGRGVQILEDHEVMGPLPKPGDPWVRVKTPDRKHRHLQSKLVMLAQGKTTTFAASHLSIEESLPQTSALMISCQPDSKDAGQTVFATSPLGVLRSHPCPGGGTDLTLLTDRGDLDKRGKKNVWQDAASDESSGRQAASVDIEDATLRLVATRDANLMFGAAAVRHSGIGSSSLASALLSAEAAAFAANTILDLPHESDDIISHHRNWERERFRKLAATELSWCHRESRFQNAPFWKSRMSRIAPEEKPTELPSTLICRRDLQARASFAPKGQNLVREAAFSIPGETRVVSKIEDIPVKGLLDLMQTPKRRNDVISEAAQAPSLCMIDPARISRAIEQLHRLGFIEKPDSPVS